VSTTRVETDMSQFEVMAGKTIHLYPRDPRYRRSGAVRPQPGDITLCGHVKVNPPMVPEPSKRSVSCEACLRLDGVLS
jgi:hypothetical protein